MIISGEQIAEEIRCELEQEMSRMNMSVTLVIVQVGSHSASSQYIRKKMAFADSIGVNVELRQFDDNVSETELIKDLKNIIDDSHVDPYAFTGVIVQLPLPAGMNTEKILAEIPPEFDVDLLSAEAIEQFNGGKSLILPPVVGAVAEILKRSGVKIFNKRVVVVGQGKLVGKPVATWMRHEGCIVQTADRETLDLPGLTREAEIIITGVGSAKLIKPEMIKDGVILIDAGTSESEGKASGDADPACAPKCTVFTPVPGGVGPITVAMLYRNLITLAKAHSAL